MCAYMLRYTNKTRLSVHHRLQLEGKELTLCRAATRPDPQLHLGLRDASVPALVSVPLLTDKATTVSCPLDHVGPPGFLEGGDRLQRSGKSCNVILFLWFSFQAVTVNLFYLSLCKSLCRIKPFTSF